MRKKSLYIGLDFDGTVTTHDYPKIGRPLPYALDVIKMIMDAGHKIILWTCRNGKELDASHAYLIEHGVKLFGVNENPDQRNWQKLPSPKAHVHLLIDDVCLGIPTHMVPGCDRPCVNWLAVKELLLEKGIISNGIDYTD